MSLRLCQLKSPLLFLILGLTGCAHDDHEIANIYGNKWFSASKEHSIEDSQSKPVAHLFFDVDPQFVSSDRSAQVIVTTPYRSQHAYNVDLPSGQRYYTHSFCEQRDSWKKASGSTSRPDFSIGYIPRVLDQLGEPQKVVIFGTIKRESSLYDTNYTRVRMVGAYVEQICMEGNCSGKNTWLSRLVFVGVDAADKGYDHVASLKSFKKAVNWNKIQVQLENMNGRNPLGSQVAPNIRVRPLLSYSEAFAYFKKRSIYFTPKELKKIQTSCHNLYEKFWKKVGEERPEDKFTKTKEELEEKLRIREELRENRKPVGFANRLRLFIGEYYSEMKTCEKFVYHGNINQNPEKFWFLSYMGMFVRLHADGYFYDCARDRWSKNFITEDGKPFYELEEGINGCSERNIDAAMKALPVFLKEENMSMTRKYRFIDYDTHTFGTHRKLYSWTKTKIGKFECGNKNPNLTIQTKLPIVPDEFPWKKRDARDRTLREAQLIY